MTPTSLAGLRVLIVEDRYLIATEMAEEIRRMGGDVVGPARDVASGSALLEGERIDAALLDVNLDGDLVFPLAEKVAARGLPFIFLSGYDTDILPPEWRDRPRLVKPVSGRTLGQELSRLARPES